MEVKKPLFIVGTGRCGSSIFHKILSYHPQVTWLSPWCRDNPSKPERNRLAMRLLDLPLPATLVRKIVYTGEFYPFWSYYYQGFSEPCRDLYKEDVADRTKIRIREAMEEMLSPKRPRLLIKITGWPRVGFLKEIFPDAKFIHIYRDGRSVVNSWLNVHWWSGWRGPENWRWGELTPEQKAKWDEYGKSFVVLAAIEWKILMTAYLKAKQTIPSKDFLEISYEDLCQGPSETFQMAATFAELEWSTGFGETVKSFHLRNTNDKWQKDLNKVQQGMLCEYLKDTLQMYGYT